MTPSRDDALALLQKHTKNPNLIKHAFCVEAAMCHYARHFGADEERWAVTGLLHDFDYEEHPSLEEHPFAGVKILRSLEYPEDIIEAILGHADHTEVPRCSLMAKALYAVDELTGFIVACALIRPSKSLTDLPTASVTKKFKDKAFCRAIGRDHLLAGAEDVGMPMEEHVGHVLSALRDIAVELGLAGAQPGGDA